MTKIVKNSTRLSAKKAAKPIPKPIPYIPVERDVRTQEEKRAETVKPVLPKVSPFVYTLANTLLMPLLLNTTRRLLIEAHTEGLTIERLIVLLGGSVSAGCCTALEHPNLMPGWGCGECAKFSPDKLKTYNSNERSHCRKCGHERCQP